MAFYVDYGGMQREIESDASSDFAQRDLGDDSEWEDPAGAFTRDTREPVKQPDSAVKPTAASNSAQVTVPQPERSIPGNLRFPIRTSG